LRRIRIIIALVLIIVGTQTCIEPYLLMLGSEDLNKYIISGLVTDQEGYQQISISLGSSIDDPEKIPLQDCEVTIKDNNGNEFLCNEYKAGEYRVWIEQQYLAKDIAFMVSIVTPSEIKIISDYDLMPACPEVDTVYYEIEEIPTSNPDIARKGAQFYIDIKGSEMDSRFYRWELIETWEYHAKYAKADYWAGGHYTISPPDSSLFYCWKTQSVDDIYSVSTSNLVENNYNKLPLHFIENDNSKLEILYSLLIKQYGISDSAYSYWEQLRINSSNNGGLYEQQPIHVKGNMHNMSDRSQEVLGYFSAASLKEKRIFVNDVNMELNYEGCFEVLEDEMGGWGAYSPDLFPIYYTIKRVYLPPPDDMWTWATFLLGGLCVDCTTDGGTVVKPEFWPKPYVYQLTESKFSCHRISSKALSAVAGLAFECAGISVLTVKDSQRVGVVFTCPIAK